MLLRASGCVAVSGGLEVASDRLLDLIQNGVTVAQVARVTRNFTEAGIMVHAYLMYGFPTQTAQETVDSLEMVRQMFEAGILQSGFWHLFAMTAHSPVGLYPERFGVQQEPGQEGLFAKNDIVHIDPAGADHDLFSYGLKKSLLNYMHGIGLEFPLSDWFDFKVPRTMIPKNYIAGVLEEADALALKPTAKIVWLGTIPTIAISTKTKKGVTWETATLTVQDKRETVRLNFPPEQGAWLPKMLEQLSVAHTDGHTFQDLKTSFEAAGLGDFEVFWYSKPVVQLRGLGLLGL